MRAFVEAGGRGWGFVSAGRKEKKKYQRGQEGVKKVALHAFSVFAIYNNAILKFLEKNIYLCSRF
jgi:hypothetical protein